MNKYLKFFIILICLLYGLGDWSGISVAVAQHEKSEPWVMQYADGSGVLSFSQVAQFPKKITFPEDSENYGYEFYTEVVGDMFRVSCPIDEKVCWYVEIYPIKPKEGDCVYGVCYLKNISDTPIYNVWAPDGCYMNFAKRQRQVRPMYQKINDQECLLPGQKAMLASLMSATIYHRRRFKDMPYRKNAQFGWFMLPHRNLYSGSTAKTLRVSRPFVFEFSAFTSRPVEEEEHLDEWWFFQIDKIIEGNKWVPIPSEWNPEPIGDDVYDFYLSDPFIGADETLLEEPSTARDEMKLTRLILEYAKGEGTLDSVTDFVSSRPFPQKMLMTDRLRLDVDFKKYPKAWINWSPCQPSDLPESWRERLLTLEEKLREIRKNALAE
ncbi:MAG: hypothetical protein Q4C70_01715 [Planctomycetia bacterium]|nr:hypothetical protein [Planctomycetia bacterium]